MITNLRGRDLISDLDFSKEEVETVLDVSFFPAPVPAAVLNREWPN